MADATDCPAILPVAPGWWWLKPAGGEWRVVQLTSQAAPPFMYVAEAGAGGMKPLMHDDYEGASWRGPIGAPE